MEETMNGVARIPVRARTLDAPLLSFKLKDEIRRLRKEPEWRDGDKNGITLAKNAHLRAVLVTLKRGAHMREHMPEGPTTLSILSGKINIVANGIGQTVGEKGLVTLRKGVRHDVRAIVDAVFLLTIVCL
jgi:quercetin dioxygenase-like cupin family protein